MQIQVSTDGHISGSVNLTSQVEAVVESALDRFADRVTRVEVHLSDESSAAKSGDDDKRCLIEARLAGMQPVTVSDCSATVSQALNGAARKLQSMLDRTLGKHDRR